MDVCVCMYMYVYVCICMYMYVCVYVYIYMDYEKTLKNHVLNSSGFYIRRQHGRLSFHLEFR